jgi:hypothetical protein
MPIMPVVPPETHVMRIVDDHRAHTLMMLRESGFALSNSTRSGTASVTPLRYEKFLPVSIPVAQAWQQGARRFSGA